MSLSKQQTTGAVCGGVFVLFAGALGYMLFDAYSTRSEKEEELADATAAFTRYNEAPVFPSKKSIDSVKSNETSYAAWRAVAGELAARGDRPPPPEEEPSVFKQRLQSEVRRMLALPGGADGKIAAPTFLFGFEQYLGESGQLPASADVPRLAVQLDAISRAVDMFAAAGVLEVKGVKRIEPKTDEDEEDAPRPAKKGKAKAADDGEKKPACLEYAFEILARPAAVVEVMNRLAADVRFAAVENFSFKESADAIVERLAARRKAEEQAASASSGAAAARRRRRGAAAAFAEEEAKPEKKAADRVVVDPETDAPILVGFTLAVYDFGTGGPAAAPAAQDAAKEDK